MEIAEYEVLLSDVETRLDRLKVLYEQWFQGMERLEPTIPRKETDRRFVMLRKELPRNTALRFRFQQLVQRYTTLQTYWQRVGRQIEEGTYRRDLLKSRKARLEARERGNLDRRPAELELDVEVELDAIEESSDAGPLPFRPSIPLPPLSAPAPAGPRAISPFARKAAPGSVVAQLPAAPTVPAAASAPTADERTTGTLSVPTTTFARPGGAKPAAPPARDSVRALPPPMRVSAPPPAPELEVSSPTTTFARPAAGGSGAATTTFSRPKDAAAKPAASPDSDVRSVYDRYVEARRKNNEPGVAYETLARSIKEMRDKLRDKYGGKSVDFEIVVRDGKVGLKPVPK